MNGININQHDGQTTAALSLHAAVRDVAGAVLHFQPPSGLAIAPQERTHALPCAHGPDTLPGTGRTLYFHTNPKQKGETK